MTEQEAKTKWCPFARTVAQWSDGSTGARNRLVVVDGTEEGKPTTVHADGLVGCQCIGSACMAWRWELDGDPRPFRVHPAVAPKYKGYTVTSEAPDDKGFVEISPPAPTTGYCGLAGKP